MVFSPINITKCLMCQKPQCIWLTVTGVGEAAIDYCPVLRIDAYPRSAKLYELDRIPGTIIVRNLKKQIEHERVREPWEKYAHPYDEIYYGTEKAIERAKERMAEEAGRSS